MPEGLDLGNTANGAPITVVIEDDTGKASYDHSTQSLSIPQADGGVVVHLNAQDPDAKTGEEDTFYANLADGTIGDLALGKIANDLIEAITADDNSRQEYLQIRARGIELLGLKIKEPRTDLTSSGVVEGMADVTNPLLLEACLKGWGNAQAELLPAKGPMKIRDDGDETPQHDDLAEALQRDMNHYLTVGAPEYYPDTSHMLLWGVYFGGSGFKKVYRCPLRRRPVSDQVDAKDLIVSDTTKDLRACERITHQIKMRPSVLRRMRMLKAYRRTTLTQPTPIAGAVDDAVAAIQGTQAIPTRPEDQPYTIWECQCELDIPEDRKVPKAFRDENVPVPYIVTIEKDSREILAIRRDWLEDDEHCERIRMYVKYPYVPGPGFYGTGLLNILGNSSKAMTAAWCETLDTGMYANFPSGLIAKGAARQNTTQIRLAPGTLEPVETGDRKIQDAVMGLPYKDITPGLLKLMEMITTQAKSVGGAPDLPVGEGAGNTPVGTIMAMIEQATQVISAAHKGMHNAQSEEFCLIIELFRKHPDDFIRMAKLSPKNYWTIQKFLQALDDVQLVPVSDPNVPSHIHRIAKAVALTQLIIIPPFANRMDPKETLKRCLAALREDPQGLLIDPPQNDPMQDPKMLDAMAKLRKSESDAVNAQLKTRTTGQELQAKTAESQSKIAIAGIDLQREHLIHDNDQQQLAVKAQKNQVDAGVAMVKAAHDIASDRADQNLKAQELGLKAMDTLHQHADAAHGRAVDSARLGLDQAAHALTVHDTLAGHENDRMANMIDAHEATKPEPKPAPTRPKKK